MKNSLLFRSIVFLIFIFSSADFLFSQLLNQDNFKTPVLYVYKITDKQAKDFYLGKSSKLDDKYFSHFVDTVFESNKSLRKFPTGHYIYTQAVKTNLNTTISTFCDFDYELMNNDRDMKIIVFHQKTGLVITDAKAKVGGSNIPFDPKSMTYRRPKTDKDGVVEITVDGVTLYSKIKKRYPATPYKRALWSVNSTPVVKYITRPLTYAIYLPIDGAKSIYRGRAIGTIYKTKYWVRNLLNGNHNNYHNRNNGSFMIFSKPSYRPNDSIKIKAFVMDDKNRVVDKPLLLTIYTDKTHVIDTIKPYRPGFYSFKFKAKAEYGMRLDRYYNLSLAQFNREDIVSNSFKYEEYELKSIRYELSTPKDEYLSYEKIKLNIGAKDENNLPVADARVKLKLNINWIDQFTEKRSCYPKELWGKELNIGSSGTTEISLPDSIFPNADIRYQLNAEFSNAENETKQQQLSFSRKSTNDKIHFDQVADSLSIIYTSRGDTLRNINARLTSLFTKDSTLVLPCKIKLDPLTKSYLVKTDRLSDSYSPSDAELFTYQFYRTKDSLFANVKNPAGLLYSYAIFERNKEIKRGNSSLVDFKQKAKKGVIYNLSIQYLWGGTVRTKSFNAEFAPQKMKITAVVPSTAYPGQKVTVKMALTDETTDKPIPDADITALGFTAKFNQSVHVALPYQSSLSRGGTAYNSFNKNEYTLKKERNTLLDYERWRNEMRLDTIGMYRFAYPENGYFERTILTGEPQALIAPYLVKEGRLLPVNLLYIDGELVYSNEVTVEQPYWFPVKSGKHTVEIRTLKQKVVFKVNVSPYSRVIVSLDPDECKSAKVTELKDNYYPTELYRLSRSLLPVRGATEDEFVYLSTDRPQYSVLQPNRLNIAGPYMQKDILYCSKNKFDRVFSIENELFEYEFSPTVTKMRTANLFKSLKRTLPSLDFGTTPYSKQSIDDMYQSFELQKMRRKIVYDYGRGKNERPGNLRLNCSLPDSIVSKELCRVLYEPSTHKKLVFPPNTIHFNNIGSGYYNLILLMGDLSFYVLNSIEVKENHFTLLSLSKDDFSHSPERLSTIYPDAMPNFTRDKDYVPYYGTPEVKVNNSNVRYNKNYEGAIVVYGKVSDEENQPLIGVSVVVEGTGSGCVTNINGEYSVSVPSGYRTISFNFIGYNKQQYLQLGSGQLNVQMKPAHMALEEVVVVGYGVQKKSDLTGSVSSVLSGKIAGVSVPGASSELVIRGISTISGEVAPLYVVDGEVVTNISDLKATDIQKMDVLKDASATAIYGSRGANGVIVITTKKQITDSDAKMKLDALLKDSEFLANSSRDGGFRHNFSDELYWKPQLKTDANGIASFETKLPDDITKWDSWVVGVLPGKSAAITSFQLKSYLPLAGKVSLPRFLVEDDRSSAIGKSLNYTGDTLKINRIFTCNNVIQKEGDLLLKEIQVDTMSISAEKGDSLRVGYQVKQGNGYKDGEMRSIPIFKKGTFETNGKFYALDRDTLLRIEANPLADSTVLYIESDALEIVKREMIYLREYKHLCNEQLASRLKSLLVERKIAILEGNEYAYDKLIRQIIAKLETNRNSDSRWGWFPNQFSENWITTHVVEALWRAKQENFKVKYDFEKYANELLWNFDQMPATEQIRNIRLLHCLHPDRGYLFEVERIHPDPKSICQQFECLELKSYFQTVNVDTLLQSAEKNLFGNIYWSNRNETLLDNTIFATLAAYRVLKQSGKNSQELQKIRNYLFSQRKGNCWRNTYESAEILETIIPDLLDQHNKLSKTVVTLTGTINKQIKEFPYRTSMMRSDAIQLRKTGSFPTYVTTFSTTFNSQPKPEEKGFAVNSYWELGQKALVGGKSTKLMVDVTVKSNEELVMIEIPIPAGCSYDEKSFQWGECHREYFTDRVCIYLRNLSKGKRTFTVNLMPRYSGIYTLNPARAEKIYFPIFYGRTGLKSVEIK